MSTSGFNLSNGGDDSASGASFADAAPETAARQPDSFQAGTASSTEFDRIFYTGGLQIVAPPVEKYCEDVFNLLKLSRPDMQTGYVDGLPNFRYYAEKNKDTGRPVVVVVQFVSPQYRDERDIGFRRNDAKNAFDKLRQKFDNVVIADLLTVLTSYKEDMDAVRQAAEQIGTVLRYKTDSSSMLSAAVFKGKTLTSNYDVQEALSSLALASPHGVLPRIETAATYQTVVANQRDFSRNGKTWDPNAYSTNGPDRPTNVATIGGYLEVGNLVRRTVNGQEQERYETFYHITAIQSKFSVLGMVAMAMSAFASHIINDFGWVPQFYNKKANGDLANILEDMDNRGNFLSSDGNDQVAHFARRMCWPPVIILDTCAGFDLFAGLNNLTTADPARRKNVSAYLAQFFGRDAREAFTGDIARFEGLTLEGYYGDQNGTLRDTRHFDWFRVAQIDGVSALESQNGRIMRMISRDDMWVICRFQLMRERMPDVLPMTERMMHAINPQWLNWVAEKMTAMGIKIQDTSRADGFARGVGSMPSEYIVDSVARPTTTLGGSSDLNDADIFSV